MKTNKRLLIITRHRLNENNGGANASKGFIGCFAALFDDCSIIYPDFDGPERFIPSSFKRYPCHDSRSNVRKGLDMYGGVVSKLSSFARHHLAKNRYDVIVIDHSFIGASLIKHLKAANACIITIHHNVERDFLNDNRKQYALSYRLPYLYFGKKAERDCLRLSNLNLTVTEDDAAEFRSWNICPTESIYHWGIFDYRPIPARAFTFNKVPEARFIITGSLNFAQSLYPILEFVHRYWPLIKKAIPTAQLMIAGRKPAQKLQDECQRQQGITIIPNPADMGALVANADYYICPINAGSGLKLRLWDGLKQGLPVLCHQVSAAGYEHMQSRGALFTYHDEASFTAALHDMLHAAPSPESVYDAFKDSFSMDAGIEKLQKILDSNNIL